MLETDNRYYESPEVLRTWKVLFQILHAIILNFCLIYGQHGLSDLKDIKTCYPYLIRWFCVLIQLPCHILKGEQYGDYVWLGCGTWSSKKQGWRWTAALPQQEQLPLHRSSPAHAELLLYHLSSVSRYQAGDRDLAYRSLLTAVQVEPSSPFPVLLQLRGQH